MNFYMYLLFDRYCVYLIRSVFETGLKKSMLHVKFKVKRLKEQQEERDWFSIHVFCERCSKRKLGVKKLSLSEWNIFDHVWF